jgi:peptidoglycan/xylan/chitin deacetylase (PgdA/CDA1 family)
MTRFFTLIFLLTNPVFLNSFLIAEGRAGHPKMMSVGLHCRLARPARAAAIQEFLDYAKSYGRDVWICTREEIANHWYEHHLPRGVGSPIQPNTFARNSYGGAAASNDTAGRFSFLGNLTVPREQQAAMGMASKNKFQSSDDGDII